MRFYDVRWIGESAKQFLHLRVVIPRAFNLARRKKGRSHATRYQSVASPRGPGKLMHDSI